MNGSEKQVAWANDIIRKARETVSAGKAWWMENYNKQPQAEFYLEWAKMWKRVGRELETFIAHPKMQDAKVVIDNRDRISPDALRKQQEKLRFHLDKHPELKEEYLNDGGNENGCK